MVSTHIEAHPRRHAAMAGGGDAGERLHNVDLKSLQVFASLVKECNVTKAAVELNMTQSAVSHTLARLRDLFHDPLFVSMGRGLVPTARALELAEPLQRALDALETLVRPAEGFDAASFTGTFRIATSDYIGFILLPLLIQRLTAAAPGIDLDIRPLKPQDDLAALKDGTIDLVLWNEESAPPNFYVRELFSDRLKAMARIGHPEIKGSLSLEQFCQGKHLRASSTYGAVKEAVNGLYGTLGIRAPASLTMPHFLLAPLLVSQSDLIGLIAELTARRLGSAVPLQVLEPPVEVGGFTVSLVWHGRRHADPAHRWLRGEIAAVAEDIRRDQALAAASRTD
ncbi:LysR family transcriptional regulator [Cupriavidus alkaliphilus]|uniref:LysR family transcriptional regulator n=1 Tax=Cupriavidus alkaliphilus TaxID=942866 RepID=UPI0010578D45|nr:LysR family transcriptional regulator [Cupriavidus alkaliphilus]